MFWGHGGRTTLTISSPNSSTNFWNVLEIIGCLMKGKTNTVQDDSKPVHVVFEALELILNPFNTRHPFDPPTPSQKQSSQCQSSVAFPEFWVRMTEFLARVNRQCNVSVFSDICNSAKLYRGDNYPMGRQWITLNAIAPQWMDRNAPHYLIHNSSPTTKTIESLLFISCPSTFMLVVAWCCWLARTRC